MAQVNQTANDLILNAYYMIGELDPDEPVPTPYTSLGLNLLNDIINEYTGTVIHIPLTQTLNITLQPNKADYTFSNVVPADVTSNRIVDVMYANILLGGISWPVKVITRTPLFNTYRNTAIFYRPTYVLVQKSVQYTTLSFYPTPDQQYSLVLQAKFYLDAFTLFSPITNVPLNVQRFLRYALGRELIAFYPSANWPEQNEMEYQRMFKDLRNTNDIDWTIKPTGLLQRRNYRYGGTIANVIGGL